MPRSSVLVLILAFLAGPVLAQERPPEERQVLLDLAFTLGESHALRQACEGADDQYWRARMLRLSEVEQADEILDTQLRDRFNAGFASRRDDFSTCDAASRKAEGQSARKGQALALKLSQTMRLAPRVEGIPDSMAEIAGPR